MQDRLEQRGVRLSSVQVQFSLLARSRWTAGPDGGLSQRRIEMLAYSPLAFEFSASLPMRSLVLELSCAAGCSTALPASFPIRQELAVADLRGVSMVQVALNWCRSHGTTPIPGLRSPDQARQAAAALNWDSAEERHRLDMLAAIARREMRRIRSRVPDRDDQASAT